MSVNAVGNPPPEADQLRAEVERQLPEIMASFSQVLQEKFGFEGFRVGGFTIVPTETTASISCNEETCSVD